MKKIVLLILMVTSSHISNSQTIYSLNVAPNGADSVDVNLETFISTTPSYYLTSSYNIITNIIDLQICYFAGNGQVPILLNNTINIPVINLTDYTLNIEIYRSSNQTTCDYTELTDTATLQFTTPLTETVYLGVEDFEAIANQISVYPNPVKDNLNIDVSGGLDIKNMKLYNILGREIETYSNGFEAINVSGLSNGVYFLTFNTSKGVVQKRVLVRN